MQNQHEMLAFTRFIAKTFVMFADQMGFYEKNYADLLIFESQPLVIFVTRPNACWRKMSFTFLHGDALQDQAFCNTSQKVTEEEPNSRMKTLQQGFVMDVFLIPAFRIMCCFSQRKLVHRTWGLPRPQALEGSPRWPPVGQRVGLLELRAWAAAVSARAKHSYPWDFKIHIP